MKVLKYILPLLALLFLQATSLVARDLDPAKMKSAAFAPTSSYDEKLNMIVFYAGFCAGGKQNTAYFLKSKVVLFDKLNLDGSVFYHFYGDRLYNANIAFGKTVSFSAGVEWGDRTYFVNKDSTYETIKFKNTTTGEYASYASFTGVTFPQQVTTYAFGLSFHVRQVRTNYWRGEGECLALFDFKWEALFAPSVNYAKTFDVTTQGAYEASTDTYLLEGAKVKKWGVRMVADTRLSSKIGMMMEFGLRPGVKTNLNDKGRFSNGYVRIGIEIGMNIGGRKFVKSGG